MIMFFLKMITKMIETSIINKKYNTYISITITASHFLEKIRLKIFAESVMYDFLAGIKQKKC